MEINLVEINVICFLFKINNSDAKYTSYGADFILVTYVGAFKKTSLNDTHYETTSGENIHHFPVLSFLVWRDKRQRLLLHPLVIF